MFFAAVAVDVVEMHERYVDLGKAGRAASLGAV